MAINAPAPNSRLEQRLRIRIFKTLSNPIRLDIVDELRKEPQTVSDLILNTGHEQSHISHNLHAMEKSCFIKKERKGKSTLYSLNTQTILPILILADKHIKAHPFSSTSKHTHSPSCSACEKIPGLALQGKTTSHLLKSHACNCKACIKNTTAISKKKPFSSFDQNHSCNCDACAENQYYAMKHITTTS